MISRLTARRSAITFDLGAAGVRAYQLARRGRGRQLCDILEVDRSPTLGDQTAPHPRLDAGELSRLVGQGGFSGSDVGLVLSPPEVNFQPVTLPDKALSQSADRIHEVLKWEVAHDSRGPAGDLEVRYWRLPRGRGQQPNVMAVTMSSHVAQDWIDRLRREQLNLVRLDVSPCALVRLAHEIWTPGNDDLWAVLDLGLRQAVVTVVVGTTPTYIRVFPTAAHSWTCQVANAFEVTYPVAERLKREHGVGAPQRGFSPSSGPRTLAQAADLPTALSSVLGDGLQQLVTEVQRCFAYMMQGFPDSNPRGLWVAGGGAQLVGLPEYLERELGIPVRRLWAHADEPPWERPMADIPCGPRAAAALGGALLDLEDACTAP
jgi:Tfp pilus assembly PilM family ATPase